MSFTNSVSHIGCPACKGAVGFTNVDRIITCSYCDAKLLVEHPDFVPQYRVVHQIDDISARRVLQRFLTQKFLPKGLLRHARFTSATLCYVPFHEYKARRLGTLEVTLAHVSRSQVSLENDNELGLLGVASPRQTKSYTRETEVVMGDIHRVAPAVELPQYGLEHCDVQHYLNDKPELASFDPEHLEPGSRVYPPTISSDEIVRQLNVKGFSGSVKDDTEYVEPRVRCVYYPLWRLRYNFAGRLYSAVIDGVTGELLVVRAPEGDQMRVWALVFGVALFGILLGNLLQVFNFHSFFFQMGLAAHVGVGGPIWVGIGIVVAAIAVFWAMIWGQFRYPGEVYKSGSKLHVEKYNSILRRRIRLPVLTPSSLLKLIVGRGE